MSLSYYCCSTVIHAPYVDPFGPFKVMQGQRLHHSLKLVLSTFTDLAVV